MHPCRINAFVFYALYKSGWGTIEHYLLHCELYFNEREAMRTTLFQQTGITELTTTFSAVMTPQKRILDDNYFGGA